MGRLSKPEKSQSPSQVPSPSLPSNASGRPVAGSRHYASKPRVEATIAPAVAPAFVFGGPSVTTTGIDPTRLHADPLGRGSRSSAAAQTAGVGTFAPRKGTAVAGTTLPAKAESWSTNAEAGPSTQSGETNHKSTVNTASASPHPSVVDPTRPRRMPVMTAAEMAVAKVAAQEGAARDAALRQAVARESAVRAAAAKDVAAGSVTANSGQAIRPGGTATPNTDILANKQSQPQPAQPAANDSNLIGTRCESCKKAKAVILQEAQIDGPDPARARAAIYRCPERTCPASTYTPSSLLVTSVAIAAATSTRDLVGSNEHLAAPNTDRHSLLSPVHADRMRPARQHALLCTHMPPLRTPRQRSSPRPADQGVQPQ